MGGADAVVSQTNGHPARIFLRVCKKKHADDVMNGFPELMRLISCCQFISYKTYAKLFQQDGATPLGRGLA